MAKTYSAQEAANYLGVARKDIPGLVKRGKLHSLRPWDPNKGKNFLVITKVSLDEYRAKHPVRTLRKDNKNNVAQMEPAVSRQIKDYLETIVELMSTMEKRISAIEQRMTNEPTKSVSDVPHNER